MTVRIEKSNGKLIVNSPYNPNFVKHARTRGKWNSSKKAWVFDERDEDWVRDMCKNVYGTDGSDANEPGVSVRIELRGEGVEATGNAGWESLCIDGITLVTRSHRDRPVIFSDNVVLVKGGFPDSGGSVKWPAVQPDDGTVVELRDIPARKAEELMAAYPETVRRVGSYPGDEQREKLLAEGKRCLSRLREIEALLGECIVVDHE